MKDRIVQYPNRFKLTQVSGDIYDIMPEPGIVTEEGTPLSKATLLSDTTAMKLGLNPAYNPTVDDALATGGWAIGDIRTTLRTDLGDSWLLCNGAKLDVALYPNLASTVQTIGAPSENWTAASFTNQVFRFYMANGYIVALTTYNDGTLYYIPDSSALEGSWSSKRIDAGSVEVYDIKYANGYWVAHVGSSGVIRYSTSITGSWSSITLSGSPSRGTGLAYGDGYWVAVCSHSSNSLYYATIPSSWTRNTAVASALYDVENANGYWVAVGDGGKVFYKSGAPTGTWSSTTLAGSLSRVKFLNGKWIILSSYGDYQIYYRDSTNPAGTWSTVTLPDSTLAKDIVYENGIWVVVVDGGKYYYSADFVNWTVAYVANLWNGVVFHNGTWMMGCGGTGGARYIYPKVPTITTAGAYVYIRGK